MRLAPLAIIIPASLVPAASTYAAEYLTVPLAQRDLFPDADTFVDAKLTLTDAQRDAIKKLSGLRQREAEQPVWRAEKQGRLLGWFIVDEVIGKHELITYAVALDPAGTVRGVEILDYRETRGGEVRDPRWRAQFVGKSARDPLRLGEDIQNLSGATLSCRHITEGVRRLVALVKAR